MEITIETAVVAQKGSGMANQLVRPLWRYTQSLTLVIPLAAVISAGCGGGLLPPAATSPAPPAAQSCSAVVVSGTMTDSITRQPVAKALAVLESGSPSIVPGSYNFSIVQSTPADSAGAFHLCVSALVQPAVVVLVAMDATGKTYPPFLSPVTATLDLGTVPMGGCSTICGGSPLPTQTAAPANIAGEVITASAIEKVNIAPQFVFNAPGSTKDLWILLMPTLSPLQTYSFSTESSGCADTTDPCGGYIFTLPSQGPVQRIPGTTNTTASTAPPGYLMSATISPATACKEPVVATAQQKGGSGFLMGTPGAQLLAANLAFSGCH